MKLVKFYKALALTFGFVLAVSFVKGANYYSRATGNWNVNTTWSATSGGAAVGTGVYPVTGDAVFIEGGFTVTVNVISACTSVQLGHTSSTASAGTLTFSNSSTLAVSGAVLVGNNISGSSGTITFTSGSTLSAGSLTLGGTIAGANGTITMTAGGTLSLGGAITLGTGTKTWTPGTGTVIFTTTNTLPATVFTAFNNLEIAGGTTTIASNLACASIQLGKTGTTGAGALTFSGTAAVTVSGAVLVGNNISGSSGTITFTSGSTLSAGSLTLGGSVAGANGTITMTAGGTLGLGGAISLGTGTKTWTPGTGTVIFNGTNTLPATVFTTFNNLLINGGTTTTGVNLTAIASLTIASGATFTTAAAHTITATTIAVNGTYTNGSTGAMTFTNLAVGSAGIYNHNTIAAAFPMGSSTSTWDAASNFNINGLVGAVNTTNFIGQSFGNVTYNCTGQTGSVDLCPANGTVTMKGSFTLLSSGATSTVFFRLTSVIFTPIINILGDFIMSGGKLDLNNDGGTGLPAVINLSGNFNMSGGTLLQSTTVALATSAFNFIGSGITHTFTKAASPTATITSTATAGLGIVFNVASGSVLDMGTSVLDGTGTTAFNLSSGAGIITAHADGLTSIGATGSIQVAGTRTFSTTANYTYNGSSTQVTGAGLPASINNLTISNAIGVTFTAAETINGLLSIGASGKANLGSFTSYAVTLNLNGVPQSTGTYGSTSSSATYKSDTYWAGTGFVSVGTIPPSVLSYPSPNAFPTNIAITPLNPTVTGVPASYTVLPALPTGLSLHPTTGVISGTPTVSTASATYTVTASNGGGSTTFGVVIAVGNNFYAIAGTAWNVASTWSLASGGTAGTSVPGAGDNVFISDASIAYTVTIPTSYNAVCGSLTIGKNSIGSSATAGVLTFTDATSTLTVGGDVIINKPNSNTITNVINLGAGTLAVSGNVELSHIQTASTTASRISQINISTGTMTVVGNLTFSATAAAQSQIVFSGAGTLNIGGSFILLNNLGTLTPSSGTVNFNGAAQTVMDVSSISYNHLTLSGSGIKTMVAGTTTISGNLTLSGTVSTTTAANLAIAGNLNVGAGAAFAIGTNFILGVTGATSVTGTLTLAGTGAKTFTGNVTVNAFGVWNETGIATINFAGNLQNDGATFTALSGTHTFSGVTKTISGASVISIPNVAVTGTYTNSGTLTVSAALSGAGGLINGNGTIGTINLGGTFGITTFTATASGNTVNYIGAGQTIRSNNYYNLTLSGSGTDILQSGTTTVGGNLTLTGTVSITTVIGLIISGNLSIGDGTTLTAAAFAFTVTGTTTVGGGASGNLTISSATGTKLFTGLVTIASGATWNNSGNSALEFRSGITTVPAFVGGTGLHTFTTNAQALTGIFTIPSVTITTITLTNTNSLTVATALSGTGGLTQAVNSTLLIGGTAGITTLTATATGNLVGYYGSIQTVHANAYYDLTLAGTGAKTFPSGTTTINNILSIEGTATTTLTGTLTYGSGATLQYKGSGAQTTGAEFPATWAGTGGVKIENASGVTLGAAKSIGAEPLYIGSTVSNSIFNDGGFQLTGTGTLNFTSGTFKLGAAAATTFPAFGTRNIADGTTVEYAATTTQTIKGINYSNLTISGSGTNSKKADADITVNGSLNLSSANASATQGCLEMVTVYGSYPGTGTPNTGPYTKAEITSYILTMGASATTTGTGDVTGIVQRNTIVTNTPYTFGQQFTTVTFSGGTMPTPVSVIITIGTASVGKTAGLQRTYEIVPTGGSSGTVAANFHFLTGELNGNTLAKLVTWDYDIGGGMAAPDEHGRSVYDITTNYYIGLANIPLNYFQQSYRTIFTMGDAIAGVETWLTTASSTAWTLGSNWSSGNAPSATDHVIIPGGAAFYPVLPSGGVTINSISFGSGGSLVMNNNTLTIQNSLSGGWDDQNAAGNDPGTSTVVFSMPGTTISGNARFYNVTIGNGADITNLTGNTMKIAGAITRTGTGKWYADTYDASIEYNGTGQTILLPDGTPNYHNLTLSGSGAKTMPASAMSVHGNFITSGAASVTAGRAMTITGNVTLYTGSKFYAGAFTHSVAGDWTFDNGASFYAQTSTIVFNNTTAAQAIKGTAGSQTFNNILIDKGSTTLSVGGSTATLIINDLTETSGNFTAPADLTVNGNATLTSGTFTAGTNTNLSGNWSNNGCTFNDNGGTVTFDGTSVQTISGTNTFNNLTINKTAVGNGVTADASQTVNGILDLNSPNHSETQGCLRMTDPYQLFMGPLATTTGTGDVSGYITRTSFFLGTDYTFGNPYTLMNFTVGPLPTSVSVEVYLTFDVPSWMIPYVGIKRYYDVTQTGGTPDTRLRFNAHYLDTELTGADGNLDFFDDHVATSTVHDHGRTDFSNATGAEWVGFGNVGLVFLGTVAHDDHLWTLGDNTTGNMCTWVGGSPSGPTDWNLPGNWEGGVPSSTSNVVIPSTTYAPVLPDGSTTIVSLNISGGILNATTGTPTLTISGGTGAWVNPGTFNSGTSTVTFSGGSSATMSGNTAFNNVTVAGGTTLTLLTGNVMEVDGTLTLNGVIDATTYANTIEFDNTGQAILNLNTPKQGYYNLIILGTRSAGATLTTLGDFTINPGANYTAAGYSHSVGGNFSNNGSFTATGSAFTFNGSSAQTIGGTTSPTAFNNVTISNTSGGVTVLNNITSAALAISSGALTLSAGKSLTATGTTTLSSAQCLVLKSDETGTASFIDDGTITGSGTAKIERYLTPYLVQNPTDWRYHFLSSPIENQAIRNEFVALPNTTDDFYSWDEATNMWINTKAEGNPPYVWNNAFESNFIQGKGYLVAYPSARTKNFSGIPYTSVAGLTMTCTSTSGGGWNLLGNPFPSPIDWDGVAKGNGMDNALYYYENDIPRYRYYISLTGGIGNSYSGGARYIPAMQGFMVHAKNSGTKTITMANSARVHESLTTYYKNAMLTSNVLNIWVEGNNSRDDARVCFYDQATMNFDGDYDAYKLFSYNTSIPELYSITQDNTQLAINTLPLSQMYGTVPLGFIPGTSGAFTLNVEGINNFASTVYIKIEDKKTGNIQKLNDNPVYSFISAPGDADNRFLLHFQDATSISYPNVAEDITISLENGIITILNTNNYGGKVTISDLAGRMVATASLLSGTPTHINMKGHPGVYIVSIITSDRVSNAKILIK